MFKLSGVQIYQEHGVILLKGRRSCFRGKGSGSESRDSHGGVTETGGYPGWVTARRRGGFLSGYDLADRGPTAQMQEFFLQQILKMAVLFCPGDADRDAPEI